MMGRVVSFINYKGGVGKTTLAVEISASLAHHHGRRVLLMDLDPQTNATFYLMEEEDWDKWQAQKGSLKNVFEAAMAGESFDIRQAIKSPAIERIQRLHLLPSHLELLNIDLQLASRFGAGGLPGIGLLRKAIEPVRDIYDYIILDCPPNLGLVTQNALVASDAYIIVAMPEFLSTVGIALIQDAVNRMLSEINHALSSFIRTEVLTFRGPELKGIIFNRIKYATHGTQYEESVIRRIQQSYPGLVFNTRVSETDKIAQRPERKVPIAVSGLAADRVYEDQLLKCAQEFIQRMEGAST